MFTSFWYGPMFYKENDKTFTLFWVYLNSDISPTFFHDHELFTLGAEYVIRTKIIRIVYRTLRTIDHYGHQSL